MIDVHTHCLQPEHWGEEHRRHWQPVFGVPWPSYGPAEFDQAMTGVAAAIVFGIRATRAGVATPNAFVARFCAEATTRCIGFMALDPTDPDALEQLEEGCGLGLRGVKLYPVLAHFRPGDPDYDRLFAEIERRRLPVLWHMGATPSAAGDLAVTQPLLIDVVAQRFPKLVQIIAHMGHPWFADTVIVLRKNANVYADISGVASRPFGGYLALTMAAEWGVADKLLFGSDYPIWTPAQTLADLRAIAERNTGDLPRISPELIERIVNRDALALLGLE
jgi:predicted TIM-barrel fold metal-dependent hydrolase